MYIRLTLILLTLCQMQSCSLIKPAPTDLNNSINLWLNENNYNDIDNALNSIDKNDVRYKKIFSRKTEIFKKKQVYISKILSISNKYKAKNQWQPAITTFHNALEKNKNNKTLKNGLSKLLKEINQNARIIKNKLLVNRTTNLLSYEKSYEQLNLLLPNDAATQYEIRLYKSELLKATSQLNECAQNAEKSKQYNLAKDCYTQAHRIAPSSSQDKKIKALEKKIKNNTNQKTYSALLQTYREAHNKKKYNDARKSLEKILSLNSGHQQAIKLYTELKLEINNFVTSKISLGKELYSQKKIQAALIIWKQAKELAPNNNELTQLITRAEKVSKKIETLELNQ